MSTRTVRIVIATAMAVALLPLTASPALAAPPINDDFDAATVVPGLPFGDAVDTREATTAPDDPDCFGNGPTVWYSFTPEADVRVAANTFGSSYDTTLSVYLGTRGGLEQRECNDDAGGLQSRVVFDAVAGETYSLMVGAFDSGPGGDLVFTMEVAPPPLELEVTVDATGSVTPRTGVAVLSGTVTCSRPAFVEAFGTLRQRAGRATIQGFFGTFLECDGTTPLRVEIPGENGLFSGGRASVSIEAFAFSADGEFASVFVEQEVRLTGKGTR